MFKRIPGEQCNDLIGARYAAMCALVGRKVGDLGTEKPDQSGVGSKIAADLIEQCRLAGAIWSDDQPPLAWPNLERHVLCDGQTPKGLPEIDDLQRVFGVGHRRSPRTDAISLLKPGTMPAGMTRTINRNTSPSSMFQRSI